MEEFVVRNFWQLLTAAIGVLGLIAAFVVLVLMLRSKQLTYEIQFDAPLVSTGEGFLQRKEIRGRLRFLFDDREVKDVHLVEVRIANAGKVSITIADYEKPISIALPVGAEILDASLVERHPDDLPLSVSVTSNVVTCSPTLLNAGDTFVVRLFVDKKVGPDLQVSCRIAGVKRIKNTSSSIAARPLLIGLLTTGITSLSAGFTIGVISGGDISYYLVLAIAVLVVVTVLLSRRL